MQHIDMIYLYSLCKLDSDIFKQNIQNSTFQPFHAYKGYPHRNAMVCPQVGWKPREFVVGAPGPNPWTPSIHWDPGSFMAVAPW